jgi:KTSC domain
MSWMKSVFSSMVSEVGYDDETQELLVKWARGSKMSAYSGSGMSEDVASECANAASVGEYLNSEIKPNYSPRYR